MSRRASFVLMTTSLAALFVLAEGRAASARTLRARLEFDRQDLRITETPSGVRVELRGFPQAGGGEAPELPMSLVTFYVPEGFEVSEARERGTNEITLAPEVTLAPRERAFERDGDAPRPFPAAALGAPGETHPARSVVSLGSGSLAGRRLHSVAVFPVRRTPRGELLFARALELELELAAADESSSATLVRLRRNPAAERAWHEALEAIVANPDDLPAPPEDFDRSTPGEFAPLDLPSTSGSAVDMVIVTPSALESGFVPLANWKTKKGVPTVIRTVEWIEANYPQGHDQAERIRLFLQDALSKWGTFLVLLGGDYEDLTPRSAYSVFFFNGSLIPTDQYWACLDGNWNADGDAKFGEGTVGIDPGDNADLLPDLFLGRAPVSTLAEVSTFVSKSFTYGKTPPSGYVQDHCVLAEVLFPPEWIFGDPPEAIGLDGKTLAESLDSLVTPGWTRKKLYQSDNTENRDSSVARLDEGHHLVTVIGHGDPFKFSVGNGLNPFVFTTDTDTLNNGNKLEVFVASACNPNQFNLESCGESMLRNPDGGAIVSIGATREDFVIPSTDLNREMYRLAFQHGVTGFGAMTQVNRVRFAAAAAPDLTPDRWSILTKNLLGDPELRFWTQEPGTLVVTHAPSVPLGTASISITVKNASLNPIAGALVCASNGTMYSRELTNASGIATLPLAASQTGTVNLAVTAANYRPHEGTFAVTSVGAAHLAMTNHVIEDDLPGPSNGNGDGRVDAGEIIELDVTAFNGGGATASSAAVTASVEPGATATFDFLIDGVRDASLVHIGPNRSHPATVPFTLDFANPVIGFTGAPHITYSGDPSSGDRGVFLWQDHKGWQLAWSGGPDSMTVSGLVTTDGRIRGTSALSLEASDALTVAPAENYLTINALTHAVDLSDAFSFAMADSTMLTVTQSSGAFGNIAPATSAVSTVVVSVSTAARDGGIAYVDLSLTSTSGGPWSATLPVAFSGPELEAYEFTVNDSNSPPVSGDGDGAIEVGETVRLTPNVLNRGSGQAESVNGSASAASGITFLDAADSYGALAPLAQSVGTDGYVFTVNNGTGTSLSLTLSDSVGRTWQKTIEFIAPPSPTGLAFTSSTNSITLTWDAADTTSAVAGYNVERSSTGGTGFTRQNFELLRSGARFVDDGLSIGDTYYYRVAAIDSSGNESLPSAELLAWTTLGQVPGWPQDAGNNVVANIGMADADRSGHAEVYVGSKDHEFYGWDFDGDDRPGFPIQTNGEIWSTSAIADLDEDGDDEILFGSNDSRLYVVHHDGTPFFPPDAAFLNLTGIGALFRSAVVVADIDHDWELEFFVGTDLGRLYAFHADGTGLSDPSGLLFTALPEGPGSRIWGPIGIADLENDGVREIVFASWNDFVYVIHENGVSAPGFPRNATAGVVNDFRGGVSIGDLDDDGTMEIIAGNDNGRIYVFNHDGTGYLDPDGTFAVLPAAVRNVAALCNVDADPELEFFIGCFDGNLYAFNHDGTGFLNPGGIFVDFNDPEGISASPIVVNVDGGSDYEILLGHRNGNFYAFHDDGTLLVGLPIPTNSEILSTAAAGDLDGDGGVDVAFGSFDQTVNVIDFPGASTPAAYQWPTYGGNNFRTSVYGQSTPYFTGLDPSAPVLAFALGQNSPNPFFSSTSIAYALPREMEVTLRVFDVTGRLVRTLVNGRENAGAHSIEWDGRDGSGRRASTGVYFYRLQGPERSLARKGVLLSR